MHKLSLFFLFVFLTCAVISNAQDCTLYFPSEKGKELTYTYYSKPGKVESSSKQIIVGKDDSGGKLKLDISSESFDAKGNSLFKFNYSVWCDGKTFYVDMRNTLSTMDLKDLGEFKIETTDMQFPSKLTPGQQLKDASITMKMEGPVPMGISVDITNRKVEALEKVTTPAGTFDCAKISYNTFSKVSIVKTEGHVTEWYAPNVGLIRSETYNKKGKLIGINELTSLN